MRTSWRNPGSRLVARVLRQLSRRLVIDDPDIWRPANLMHEAALFAARRADDLLAARDTTGSSDHSIPVYLPSRLNLEVFRS